MRLIKRCICFLLLFPAFTFVHGQNVRSVNNQTGPVELELELSDHNLSITGGSVISLPVTYDTLWAELGTDINSTTIGNVGIGTDTFQTDARLTVNGKIHAEELIIDLNFPGPDYVFEEDYPLMDLLEVENYIIKNKHLPEVPSAKDFNTHGITLSEMNMLILKKVEELTLYMINHENRLLKLEDAALSSNRKKIKH